MISPGEGEPEAPYSHAHEPSVIHANFQSLRKLVAPDGMDLVIFQLSENNSEANNHGQFVKNSWSSQSYRAALIDTLRPRDHHRDLASGDDEFERLSERIYPYMDRGVPKEAAVFFLEVATGISPKTKRDHFHALFAFRDKGNSLKALKDFEAPDYRQEAVYRFGASPQQAAKMLLIQLQIRRLFPEFYETSEYRSSLSVRPLAPRSYGQPPEHALAEPNRLADFLDKLTRKLGRVSLMFNPGKRVNQWDPGKKS